MNFLKEYLIFIENNICEKFLIVDLFKLEFIFFVE